MLERTGIDDDLLVVAGDNLFDFSLAGFAEFRQAKGTASAVAVHDCGDVELATHYGVVELAEDDRIVSFEEKPSEPRSTLVGDRGIPLRPRPRCAHRALPRRREPARPTREARLLDVRAGVRVRATASRAPGTTWATPISCSKPTTAGASGSGSRVRERVFDARLTVGA